MGAEISLAPGRGSARGLVQSPLENRGEPPKAAEMVVRSFEVIQRAHLETQVALLPSGIVLLSPPLRALGMLCFRSVNSLCKQCEQMVKSCGNFLEVLRSNWPIIFEIRRVEC